MNGLPERTNHIFNDLNKQHTSDMKISLYFTAVAIEKKSKLEQMNLEWEVPPQHHLITKNSSYPSAVLIQYKD